MSSSCKTNLVAESPCGGGMVQPALLPCGSMFATVAASDAGAPPPLTGDPVDPLAPTAPPPVPSPPVPVVAELPPPATVDEPAPPLVVIPPVLEVFDPATPTG